MSLGRRQVLVAGSLTAAAGALGAGTAHATGRGEETKSLEQLYREAKAEGGALIVYAGGDTATQQDGNKAAFEKAFPGITLDIVVDYSKFHDARVDNQLATGTLVPDVVQLQTLQDFPRWKGEGACCATSRPGSPGSTPPSRTPTAPGPASSSTRSPPSTTSTRPGRTRPPPPGTCSTPGGRGRSSRRSRTMTTPSSTSTRSSSTSTAGTGCASFVAQDVAWVRGTQEPADRVEAGTAADRPRHRRHADPGRRRQDPLRRADARPVHGLGPARRHPQAAPSTRPPPSCT